MERARCFVAVGFAGLLAPALTARIGLPLGVLGAVTVGCALASLTVVAVPTQRTQSGRR